MATKTLEKTKYGKLTERTPTNYPFNLRDDQLSAPDTYKEDYNYCLILVDPHNQKPIDIRIVKTTATLKTFIEDKHYRHGLDILFHPNPIKLTAEFWRTYRQTESGAERLKLFTDLKVLTDANMLFIDTITIDIDSPFNEAVQALNDLTKELDIPAEILEIRETKSGNLRFSFSIQPIKPHTLNKNGKTNLENLKEFVSIINNYFKTKGLKADDSFKRINHPVWITKPEHLILEATEEINFYTLYRKAKNLNKRLKQQEKEKAKKAQRKKPRRRIAYLPAFIANKFRKIENETALEKAVRTLASTHRKGRYIHLLQPVAGWCKYLGLSYQEYYDLVYPYASDKREDIKKAWRYARPLEFKNENPAREYKYDLVEYADKVIEYLRENGATERQILLKEVFNNQKWLEQLIMQELKAQGLIREWFEKQEGRGRPKKVYEVIENKGSEDGGQEGIDIQGFESSKSSKQGRIYFSQINNSLFREYTGGGWLFFRERLQDLSLFTPYPLKTPFLLKNLLKSFIPLSSYDLWVCVGSFYWDTS